MLYLQHFGLRESPFGITPDTSFFYACTSIQEALNTLLVALAEGLGIKLSGDLDQPHLIKTLYLALLDFARTKKRVVMCLDETQAMPLESLESLRLLTNLETEKRKLVQ